MGQINRLKKTVSELQQALREMRGKQDRLQKSVSDLAKEKAKVEARVRELNHELEDAHTKVKEVLKKHLQIVEG